MIKFVECIAQLPNLKTLEIVRADYPGPISPALRQKHAIFPSIRELRITPKCYQFIRNCPNLETLTFTRPMTIPSSTVLLSYGKGLNRVAGLNVSDRTRAGLEGVFLKKLSHQSNYSAEAYHSGISGLSKPSGDWHHRQNHLCECFT